MIGVLLKNLPDGIEIPEEITRISVDTRDFAIIMGMEPIIPDSKDGSNYHERFYAYPLLDDPKCKDHFKILNTDLIRWIKDFEERCGGKSDWKSINLIKGYKDVSGWDFKYLRFYRYRVDPRYFIACTNVLKAFNVNLITRKNIKVYGS